MRAIVLLSLIGVALAGCTTEPVGPGNVVTAQTTSFSNGDLTVSVGEIVTFEMAQASHTVDFSEAGEVNGVSQSHSGNLDPGDVYKVTFTEPGTYPYFCKYHSSLSGGQRIGMVGTITVV